MRPISTILEEHLPLVTGCVIVSRVTREVFIDESAAWELRLKPIVLTNQEFDVIYMLARAGRGTATHDEIIAHVWGQHPPADPRNNLRTYIYRIRRKFESARAGASGWILTHALGYELDAPLTRHLT
jgi:DNA-binding response OmpR family regulator